MKKNQFSRTSFGILFSFIVCLLVNNWCYAQNLVPNPGFETILSPVTGEGQIQLAQPWSSPVGGTSTPDLFNAAYTGSLVTPCDAVGVPSNVGGYAPALGGGNGYAGISIDFVSGIYEYLQIPLIIPMQSGDLYTVTMDVLLADSSAFACNRFGVLISNNAFSQSGSSLINITPQWEYASNAVTDTGVWTPLTFTPTVYTAQGGENFITIGVFRAANSSALTLVPLGNKNTGCANFDTRAYYYIDNVVVKPLFEVVAATTEDTIVCPNESTQLTANSNVPFHWSSQSNGSDTISLNIDYTATPPATTTYYLFGQTLVDSITIYVINPPVFDLGADTTFCEGDTVILNAFATDGILYTWSTGDTTATTAATDTGVYLVTVDNIGCGVQDSIHFYKYLPNPAIDLGFDSTYCFFDKDTLFLDAGSNSVAYKWIPFGDTTEVIKVLTPAYYQVTATRANGCKRKAGFEVIEVCAPKIFIPTAFTPDGDGLNDLFLPRVNNVDRYSLQVYSRSGKLLFSTGDLSKGWDGKYNGKEVSAGVYIYRLFYGGYDSNEEKIKGKFIDTITLIR